MTRSVGAATAGAFEVRKAKECFGQKNWAADGWGMLPTVGGRD